MPANDIPRHYPGRELEAMSLALNYHRWIVSKLEPYLGETIIEVGAGIGSVSKLLLEQSIKRLLAFEPSSNMYPMLVKALGDEPRATAINDFFRPRPRERCDSVVYINVLEHVEDDSTEVANAFEALKPNGHLLVFVPALMALYSNLDKEVGHFRRYSRRGLVGLVEHAGFKIVKAQYFDVAGIVPWYINFVLLQNSISAGGVAFYDKLVVPLMKRVETLIPPPIGKNVLLVARK